MYGGYTVTEFSTPFAYYYNRSDADGALYLCIVEKNAEEDGLRLKNTGARCKTDADGNIIAGGSITDSAHCSSQVLPTPTPTVPRATATETPED
ncbi:hypothetical protein A2334_02360 [Candidatus Roizmanbacteria bacterium RIFOXYB2_FULL_38_10]|uniref:Uncharacterized protein n=1 Tax=Candidatus Roizmanbacteria bacterium RIFOXYD1_FULL_38_12 TaxID=1802093 RepID=A0A1F7L0B2_9BACT|nr:MAG: hypothetical protein A3K47_01610 [Candidatus Roizmanbacteria bacterium RIFOXYA2_FULL_38_14]OGK63481.1 MAG: hypothetical protein A3K27_01610 [Candidatus Roizmanbacteria bacterium RIFOXYA1_FULL_37_12]OGK65327.1 MAG: hypothetical protein A3K38_01610 [Candidatus Roizmanbacteria bacterium RIFOXYB1_FULL_40_23]OGK67959.1 MAG: hypothetical protein A2334_02360 [Candidatus Roizmanbacteria bacterium RIFOXYB2_FULL_38_10]OGK69732.1 MAG: hypothetical protein A3K21_01615 [Candidatus Roizmanbacteria ba